MRARLSALALLLVPLIPLSASARFHLWRISEVYSNADGSVQFVELSNDADLEDLIAGHNLTSNSTTYSNFTNLSTTATTNHHLLIATPAFASQPGAVPPDFTFNAANFMSTVSDTINFAAVSTLTYTAGQLPTDGYHSIQRDCTSAGCGPSSSLPNTPTNFAGQSGQLPEPSAALGLLAGGAALFLLSRARCS